MEYGTTIVFQNLSQELFEKKTILKSVPHHSVFVFNAKEDVSLQWKIPLVACIAHCCY